MICTVFTSLHLELSDYKVSRHDILKHKKINEMDDSDAQECVISD
jgi:hypothetical protein